MRKNFFATAALSILALTSLSALSANAQQAQSCPNQETFGERRMLVADNSAQSQIEVTYFTTNDPNAFISEKAGLNRSATYANPPNCPLFQSGVLWNSGCDRARAQTMHAGSMNVCMGDGSVRGVSANVSAITWARVCDPRDGNSLDGDWTN